MGMIHAAARWAAVLLLAWLPLAAAAQTTGGVYGPSVSPDHRSAEYRIAFDPDSDAVAHRVQYQRSLDSRFRWRLLAQGRKTEQSSFDFDFVQGELVWDITDASESWQTGMRFDFRLRDRGRPARGAVSWMNQFRLGSGWSARLLGITSFEIGSGAQSGLGIQTRANLYRSLASRQRVGLEMFSSYGTTSDLVGLDDQRHQLGPFTSVSTKTGWNVFAGALFGLTDPAPDTELRLWLGRSF